jgi:DNA-binding transcriptional MerR regulator
MESQDIIDMKVEKSTYKTSEVATIINIEKHNVIQWAKEFKLDIARNSKGHRLFTEHDIEIYKIIAVGKRNGMITEDIKKVLTQKGLLVKQMENSLQKTQVEKITLEDLKSEMEKVIHGAIGEASQKNNKEIYKRIDSLEEKLDRLLKLEKEKKGFWSRLFRR